MIRLGDVQSAAQRISPYVIRTPQGRNRTLSDQFGTNVHLKYELFQRTGSFKPRGAFNQILHLPEAARERGVVAVSGGNFAQGVAYAGGVLGIKTVVLMPEFTPANYVDATRSYGATVELTPDIASAFERVEAYVGEGYGAVHPYDNPHQMAGTGTVGLEILEDLPGITDIFISVGGGGLLAGNIVSLKALKPDLRIWAVETEGAEALGRALEAGQVVRVAPTSLARTLGAPYVAADALKLAQSHLAGYLVVTDREAAEEQRLLLERAKVLTELAAACTLAAARRMAERFRPEDQVVLLLCGGNESLSNMADYSQRLATPVT
jgi:threonine dehydratase